MGAIPDNPEYQEAEDALQEYLGPNRAPKGGVPRFVIALVEMTDEDLMAFVLDNASRDIPKSPRTATAMMLIREEVEGRDSITGDQKEILAVQIAEFMTRKQRGFEKEAEVSPSVKDLVVRIAVRTAAMIAEERAREEWVDLVVDPETGIVTFPA